MWSDNDTNRDFLNFRCVADTAAEMIVQAKGRPLSLGVSGGWGVGKSSMLNLLQDSLQNRNDKNFVFVEFNAWLYQGYDDARAALIEVIASKLVKHGEENETGLEKAKAFLGRVNWLRTGGLLTGSAVAMGLGLGPIGLPAAVVDTVRRLTDGTITRKDIKNATEVGSKVTETSKTLFKEKEVPSPPQQIHELRQAFEETLEEMGVTLVVFVDDLDRCLPETAISTLEAIRLFLFLSRTAFVIAADDRMIRRAVKVHFKGLELDDDLVTNYFDKLVQVPLRVPPLGTQEVRAYLMLLFIENSDVDTERQEAVRQAIGARLAESWKGLRVDLKFVREVLGECPEPLQRSLDLADRLAPLMTTSKQIGGNPRLIKRFLNTLAIRLAIARTQRVAVDEGALAKMLLFERCASHKAYAHLLSAINDGDEGRPAFLTEWEALAVAGEELGELPAEWNDDFITDWLALAPRFGDLDLRGVAYVSREHMPIVTAADQLSSEAASLLEALMVLKDDISLTLAVQLRALPGREATLIGSRLMVRARQEQSWGTPPVFWAYLTLIEASEDHAEIFVEFLKQVAPTHLKPDIVAALSNRDWATSVLDRWTRATDTPSRVKKAITVLNKKVQ